VQILRTPLHWACTQGNVAVMEYLISVGADLTIKNNVSNAPHLCDHPSAQY
jgi:ankyrin repeat protein